MVQRAEVLAGDQEPRLGSLARLPTRLGRDVELEDGNQSRVWIEASAPPSLSPGTARCLLRILLKATEIGHQVDPEAAEAQAVSS